MEKIEISDDRVNRVAAHLATGAAVSVGGCDYAHDSTWEREPDKHFTQSALAVRDQLRAKYDTCS